jgi:hypothetical protein
MINIDLNINKKISIDIIDVLYIAVFNQINW